MTTSRLVGPETPSSQDPTTTQLVDLSLLHGATERVGAYSRLKSWLRLPAAEAAAAASAFRQAVATLPHAEQVSIAEAEADALRHGFSFLDFQKLKDYALRAIEDPYVAAAADDESPSYLIASMLAMANNN
jgi:hypothetical protein